jgi:hypothetical protein
VGGGGADVLLLPDGSVLSSWMDLPERGVVPALKVPLMVKGWLTFALAVALRAV